jgi:hypothetical protein
MQKEISLPFVKKRWIAGKLAFAILVSILALILAISIVIVVIPMVG